MRVVDVLEWIGLIAFAASGALVGVAKQLDLFGVGAVSIVTGVGGGVVRDLFLGIHPPSALRNAPVLGTALATALVVFFGHSIIRKIRREILILDAFGMGLFAGTGTVIALGHNASALPACLVGATTAIGGGVLRDVAVNEVPLLLQRDLYAIPALIGSATVALLQEIRIETSWAMLVGITASTGLRLVALWLKWSLPQPRAAP